MTNNKPLPTSARAHEPVTPEEGLRLMKVFESIPRKSDRNAVIEYAARLAQLTSGDGKDDPSGP
jgi:hypothetical protein